MNLNFNHKLNQLLCIVNYLVSLIAFTFLMSFIVFIILMSLTKVVYCETSPEGLPSVIAFKDLHLTPRGRGPGAPRPFGAGGENFFNMIHELEGLIGIYCIKNLITGQCILGLLYF